ncbi:YdcF family protein [Romeria aff. gracilis LEGE 07310]|uniref:YdcF family protein n=1 Tax=Vasconcelosia minhoensis LEGE 07310 TaxID=915328 RepID=A0A8J7AWE4_9CYAN|nr:YdcF family protein [Romeria gracilis]MBE9080244.1 YdcF family protein [Romeria aff. gracilis LEGE 07310]
MLVLLTRLLLWASLGLLIWYLLVRIIPRKYLTWFGGFIVLALILASFLDPNDETIGTVWQVISLPLTPLGLAVILLGFSLSEGVRKVKGTQVAIALAILLFSSVPILARTLVGQAEQSVQQAFDSRREICQGVCPTDIPGVANIGQAGAIVVLGESSGLDGTSTPFRTNEDSSYSAILTPRLLYAADLYRQARSQGSNPFVIVTAGSTGNDEARNEQRQAILDVLGSAGVPGGVVQIQNSGLNARQAARDVEGFLQNQQVIRTRASRSERESPRIALVAPAISMRRAALTFEKMDLQVIARPTHFFTSEGGRGGDVLARLPDVLPSVSALELTTRYWNELLTSIYYFLRGWLPSFNFGWDSNIEI